MSRIAKRVVFVIGSLYVASACRLGNVGKDMPTEGTDSSKGDGVTAAKPRVQPQRSASTEAPAQVIAVTLTADGDLQQRLSSRLDYISGPQPGGITTAQCFDALSGRLQIGDITCNSDDSKGAVPLQAPVTIDQTDQICYTESVEPRIRAKGPVRLPGCTGAAALKIYKFTPEIKVELIQP